MKDLGKRLFAGAAGSLTWSWGSGSKSSIGYYVTGSADWPTVHLHYRWNDKEDDPEAAKRWERKYRRA